MNTPMLSRESEFRSKILLQTVLTNPFCPHKPHPKQAEFLLEMGKEVMFGGAAGGGKSDALLMAALQFVEVPGYSAIIFRKTYSDLSLPKALMSRAREWLAPTDAKWNDQSKTWRFPSGATLTFGYLDTKDDRYRYQSAEFQFVAFDELTQFKEEDYRYLFSRLRRLKESVVPLRMRSATNPGGIGHAWVKRRFGIRTDGREPEPTGRKFIKSFIRDNPSLDEDEYMETLSELDARTRAQLKSGDWSDFHGNHFIPGGWPIYDNLGDSIAVGPMGSRQIIMPDALTTIVGVDWAEKEKKTNDATAFVVGALTKDGRLFILEVVNQRLRPELSAPALSRLCEKYKPSIVGTEDDILSLAMVRDCRRQPHIPEMRTLPIGGKTKRIRATEAIIYGENKLIHLPDEAPWLEEFTDQLAAFTGLEDEHDDMVDALGIVARLANQIRGTNQRRGVPMAMTPARNVW